MLDTKESAVEWGGEGGGVTDVPFVHKWPSWRECIYSWMRSCLFRSGLCVFDCGRDHQWDWREWFVEGQGKTRLDIVCRKRQIC